MGRFSNTPDSDLHQTFGLLNEIAEDARDHGNSERLAEAHEVMNEALAEAESRGWS